MDYAAGADRPPPRGTPSPRSRRRWCWTSTGSARRASAMARRAPTSRSSPRARADERVAEILAAVEQDVVIGGHTHMRLDRRVGRHRVLNPGSVGMPYEGRPGAFWASSGPTSSSARPPTTSTPPRPASAPRATRRRRTSSRRTCSRRRGPTSSCPTSRRRRRRYGVGAVSGPVRRAGRVDRVGLVPGGLVLGRRVLVALGVAHLLARLAALGAARRQTALVRLLAGRLGLQLAGRHALLVAGLAPATHASSSAFCGSAPRRRPPPGRASGRCRGRRARRPSRRPGRRRSRTRMRRTAGARRTAR